MEILSRNSPISYVVGAAGFLGSHLADRLLELRIQVVGVDDLSFGSLDNLRLASRNKNFHFIQTSGSHPLPLSLPRLDYAFFIISEEVVGEDFVQALEGFLKVIKQYSPKILFVSSIELYEKDSKLNNLRDGEKRVAGFARELNLNARIVRLAAVFGPRMHFRYVDPIIFEIKSNLQERRQASLDFITRALFISDAISLLIKAMMHSATAQKIFDGCLNEPIKVDEIKQILLDPLWHENSKFSPTPMPSWPTPNLEKTEKNLSWSPKTNIIEGLKQTISYFRENPGRLASLERDNQSPVGSLQSSEKKEDSQTIRQETVRQLDKEKTDIRVSSWQRLSLQFNKIKRGVSVGLFITVVVFALIYPLFLFALSLKEVKDLTSQAKEAVTENNFSQALNLATLAEVKSEELKQSLSFLNFLKPISQSTFDVVLYNLNFLAADARAVKSASAGGKDVLGAWKRVTGESDEEGLEFKAHSEIEGARVNIDWISSSLKSLPIWGFLEGEEILKTNQSLKESLEKFQSLTFLMTEVLAKDQLFLLALTDNSQLRPGGGVVISLASLEIKGGKVTPIKVLDLPEIEKKSIEKIQPPKELRTDLKIDSLKIKDALFDPDFPTSAQTLIFTSNQTKTSGVIVFDLEAISKIVFTTGEVNLLGRRVKAEEIATGSLSSQELEEVFKEVLNRLFFSNNNWLSHLNLFSDLLEGKHINFYFTDRKLFSYLKARGGSGSFEKLEGDTQFISLIESSILGNNFTITRSWDLETTLASDQLKSKLTVNFLNSNLKDPSKSVEYHARLKVFLPLGTNLQKAFWGNKNILGEIQEFSDYGLGVYSFVLHIPPRQEKILNLEFLSPKLKIGKQVKYHFFKQIGSKNDKIDFKFQDPTLPYSSSFQLSKDQILQFEVKR